MAAWQNVAPAQALEHPLYGLRGWLRIPSIGFVLLLLGMVLMLVQAPPPPPWRWSLWEGLGVIFVLATPIAAILWFRRWRHFRPAFLAFALLSGAYEIADVTLMASTAADPGGEVAMLAISLALDAALLAAMQRSRRFRVTFEHRLRVD